MLNNGAVVGQATGGGPKTVAVTLPADGTYSLSLAAEDEAGNRSLAVQGLTVTLDRSGPSSISAELAAGTSPSAEVVTIVGQTVAGSIVSLYRPNDPLTAIRRTTADAAGAFQFENVAVATPGMEFRIAASDAAGNSVDTNLLVTTTAADTRGPEVVLQLRRDTGRNTSDKVTSVATVMGTIDDAGPIDQLTARVNGSTPFDILPWLVGVSFNLTADRLASITGAPLVDGDISIVIDARDSVANASGTRQPSRSRSTQLDPPQLKHWICRSNRTRDRLRPTT